MRKVEMYQCEICKEVYVNEKDALTCERVGNPMQHLFVGQKVLYEIETEYNLPPRILELKVLEVINKGHYFEYRIADDEGEFLKSGNDEEFIEKMTIINAKKK